MLIRELHLAHFMNHVNTRMVLPPSGCVLVTGQNGSGKSSLIEAASYSLFGSTLRSTLPWSAGQAGEVMLISYSLCIKRSVSAKGRQKLEWHDARMPPRVIEFDSTSKAAQALAEVVGPPEVWRRCNVFSSSDAAHFSTATDSERKLLIERLLGMDRFDTALSACRADIASAKAQLAATEREQIDLTLHANSLQHLLDNWGPSAELVLPPEPRAPNCPEITKHDLARAVSSEHIAMIAYQEAAREPDAVRPADLIQRHTEAALEARHALKHLELVQKGQCPTCGAKFCGVEIGVAQESYDAAKQACQFIDNELSEWERQAGQENILRQKRVSELHQVSVQQKLRLQEAQRAEMAWAQYREAYAGWLICCEQARARHEQAEQARLAKRAQTEACLEEYREQAQEAAGLVTERRQALALLAFCERVLGLQGVRVHVLGRALSGVEAVANGWLGKLGNGAQVRLRPWTELKGGGLNDKISLEVEGFGGGQGYKASSGGERRRIDTALLLALAEVASAASGHTAGTLWLDEVGDALDEEGLGQFGEIISEIAEHRCVVLLTHREELAKSVKTVASYKVEDGKLTPQ